MMIIMIQRWSFQRMTVLKSLIQRGDYGRYSSYILQSTGALSQFEKKNCISVIYFYKFYLIKFTLLKSTLQSVLVYSRNCESSPQPNFKILSPPAEIPYPLVVTPMVSTCQAQALTNLSGFRDLPTLEKHINGIMKYFLFLWLLSLTMNFSKFIHTIAYTTTLFLFITK